MMPQGPCQQHRTLLRRRRGFDDDTHLALRIGSWRQLHAVTAVHEQVRGNLVSVLWVNIQKGDLPVAQSARAFEFDAQSRRATHQPTPANAGYPGIFCMEFRRLGVEYPFGINLQLRMRFLIQGMRRYRVHRAATLRIRGYEKRRAILIDFGHQAIRWRSRLARDGATLQHVPDMVCEPRTDAVPDHIRREYRGIASPAGNHIL